MFSQLLPSIEMNRIPAIVTSAATRPPTGKVSPALQGDPSTVAPKTPLLSGAQVLDPPELPTRQSHPTRLVQSGHPTRTRRTRRPKALEA